MTNNCSTNRNHYLQNHHNHSHGGYHNNSQNCQNNTLGGRGKLHKSLSFAFQTPNDMQQHTCQNAANGYYDRCSR